jgi:hypothetical protein
VPTSRPFRVAHIEVDDRWVYASDEAFPVVAQLGRETGRLERLFWWPISPEHRRRSASTALLSHGRDLWVSSPLAGGVARIDKRTGVVTLIALEDAPGPIAVVGDTIFVLGDADWLSGTDDEEALAHPDVVPNRPVVWAEGTDEATRGLDVNDDFSFHLPPRPVWRIDGDIAAGVDLGGDVSQLVPIRGDEFVVVLRRPEDPVVQTADEWGGVSYSYPGVIARCDARAKPTVLVNVSSTGGSLFADGDSWWLSGFGFESSTSELVEPTSFGRGASSALFSLDIETGRLEASAFSPGPVAIVDHAAVVIGRGQASSIGGTPKRCEARCFALDRRDEPRRVELPREVDTFRDIVTSEGQLWFVSDASDALVWLDPAGGASGVLTIDIDLAASLPTPVQPDGTDLESFERQEHERLRTALLRGWRNDVGGTVSFIAGIEIESVELRGRFPDAHVVARFRAVDRSGVLFARRWNLYDELGNLQEHEYADVLLMEDIEAGSGLPPTDECLPDDEGIVWL